MNCLVTGAAGFIGSHLCRRLLKEGHYVSGIDSFTDYYPRRIKEANLAPFSKHERFKFFPEDINKLDLNNLLQNIDAVFHLAEGKLGKKLFNLYQKQYRSHPKTPGNCQKIPFNKIYLCFLFFSIRIIPRTSHERNKHTFPFFSLWSKQACRRKSLQSLF